MEQRLILRRCICYRYCDEVRTHPEFEGWYIIFDKFPSLAFTQFGCRISEYGLKEFGSTKGKLASFYSFYNLIIQIWCGQSEATKMERKRKQFTRPSKFTYSKYSWDNYTFHILMNDSFEHYIFTVFRFFLLFCSSAYCVCRGFLMKIWLWVGFFSPRRRWNYAKSNKMIWCCESVREWEAETYETKVVQAICRIEYCWMIAIKLFQCCLFVCLHALWMSTLPLDEYVFCKICLFVKW